MKKLLIVEIKVGRSGEHWDSYESRTYRLPFDSTGPNADKMDTNDLMEYAHTLDIFSKVSIPQRIHQITESQYPCGSVFDAVQEDLDDLGLTAMQVRVQTRFERVKP